MLVTPDAGIGHHTRTEPADKSTSPREVSGQLTALHELTD